MAHIPFSLETLSNSQDFDIYKGTEEVVAFEESLVNALPDGETQYIIGGGAGAFISFFGDKYEEISSVARAHGFKAKYIGAPSEREWLKRAQAANSYFEYRILDVLPTTSVQTAIRFNSVTFYSFGNPPLVYIVKSKSAYEDYRKFFDALWDLAK
ncbi:MAG TPA: hypothetical protein VG984_03395 [Candidatus Paceibacterota bacterium]|nr:hypothetical protein [Candidatus Paceibacterota bacterium]